MFDIRFDNQINQIPNTTPALSQNIGKTQSHGCIRMTNWSARRVADVVKPGTVALLEE